MAQQAVHVQPALLFTGPPAPCILKTVARAIMLLMLVLVVHWIYTYLGGLALAPENKDTDSNDTSKLFNWHPILMYLGFGVFMSEAVLAYQAPVLGNLSRSTKKVVHVTAHTLASVCIVCGLVAVFKSHSLKRPMPIPDLYSPHSWLGLTTVVLGALQLCLGLYAYVWPKFHIAVRIALGPVHRFLGITTWVLALSTMAAGFQEKVTFLQTGMKLSGDQLYSDVIRIPALLMLLLFFLGTTVLYHLVPVAQPIVSEEPVEECPLLHAGHFS